MAVEIHQSFPDDIDTVVIFNQTKPLYVDYRGRSYYYLFSLQNLDVDAGQYGTLHLQAGVWYELPVEQSTRLAPVGINSSSPQQFTVITRATNRTYTPIPPPLQFDISNVSRNTNGTILGPLGIPYYKLAVMQLVGTWTGNVVAPQSVNGVDYINTAFTRIDDTTQARITTATFNSIYHIPLTGRYIRFDISAITGTITGSFIFFMNPVDL